LLLLPTDSNNFAVDDLLVAPILDILKQATGGKLETIGKKRREVEESLRDIVAGIDMGKKSGGALRQLTGKKGEFTEL
jgi:hypothetical protein